MRLKDGERPVCPRVPRVPLNQFGTALIGSTYNQAITNGSGTERISIRYITPIPAIDLIGKTPAQRQDIADEAGSRVTGVTFVPPKQQ